MRKYLAAAFLIAGLWLAMPHSAAAHVLAQDNGVSSVLHIPPFDAPETGEATTLEFQFGNAAGDFHLSDYKLALTVNDGDATVNRASVQPAYFGSANQGSASVNFETPAVYTIKLVGMPLQPAVPAFSVHYNVRVVAKAGMATTAAQRSGSMQTVYIELTVLVLFIMFAVRQVITGKRYSKQRKEK